MQSLKATDLKLSRLIKYEEKRQSDQIRLIPSENYTSKAVREAVGSVLMNKYSEGQAGKRYYQGNINIDKIEIEVKSRAIKLFNLDEKEWHVNVQAVTGSVANLAVYNALIDPGDKIMGMYLYDGGHLSHGWKLESGKKVSFTSKVYESSFYYVDPNKRIFDYDQVEKRAKEEKPRIIISGGTAYPREINHARMREIADSVGAHYMADIAHEAGLVATGANKSPFPHADIVTMTTRKTLRGPIGSIIFIKQEFADALDRSVFPGLQGGPQNHSIAGIGVALKEAMKPEFTTYTNQIIKNAQTLANELIKCGFDVTSGGTDKHLILVDLRSKNLAGTELAEALEQAGIIVNKNTVPGDTAKPWNPSGIRLGTPAITTRGMKEPEMIKISNWINQVSSTIKNNKLHQNISKDVSKFLKNFETP